MKSVNIGRRSILVSAVAFSVAGFVAPEVCAQTLKEKVAREGKLTIGIYGAWPAGFTKDGSVFGIYPEVLRAVAGPLGLKKIEFQVMDFSALIPSLLARRIDVVAGGMYIKPDRCKQVSFSDPIGGPSGNAILVKKGNPMNIHGYEDMAKNPNVRVGDLRSAASIEYLKAAGVPNDRILLYPDKDAALGALLADRAGVAIFDSGTVAQILSDPNVKGVERGTPFKEIAGGQELLHYGAIAFRPEDAAFRDVFNKGLADRSADGAVEKIFLKYGFSMEEATATSATAKDVCGDSYQ